MVNESEITELCDWIKKEHPKWEKVSIVFMPFNELKIKWTRSFSVIDLSVSDYLEDAPAYVLKGILKKVIANILGNKYTENANSRHVKYLKSEKFRKDNVDTFIERHVMREMDTNDHQRFMEIVAELRNNGQLPDDINVFLAEDIRCSDLGDDPYRASPIFKCIGVDPLLNENAMRAALIAGTYEIQKAFDEYPDVRHCNDIRMEGLDRYRKMKQRYDLQ